MTRAVAAVALEAFLARLYVDPAFAARVRAAPREAATAAGLSPADAQRVEGLDWDDVAAAAASFAAKRAAKARAVPRPSAWGRLWARLARLRRAGAARRG